MTASAAQSQLRGAPQPMVFPHGAELPVGSRTLLMGVVNTTPDSFYPESRTPGPAEAVERALRLVEEGADLLDVGGESTRPGSDPVPLAEELDRVLPVLEGIRRASPVPLSIDTRKAAVAGAALDAGASLVNDTSGGSADPAMLPLLARSKAVAILMHMRGTPRDMQQLASYGDVVEEVRAELRQALDRALAAGIAEQRIWLDPGIGFAKTARHNLEVLRRLGELRGLGRPLVVGASRKSFLGKVLPEATGPAERLEGSLAAAAVAAWLGVEVLRVHDVAATRRAVRVVEAIRDPLRAAP